MRAKNVMIPFEDLIQMSPSEIQEYTEKMKSTPQSPEWHPEGDVYVHTNIVYNRAMKTGDIDQIISALFHDLGKVDTTKKNKKGTWSAYGHEFASAKLVLKHANWISSIGGNPDKVHFIVIKHMVSKMIDQMRPSKREKLKEHEYFPDVQLFNSFDNMKTWTINEFDPISITSKY